MNRKLLLIIGLIVVVGGASAGIAVAAGAGGGDDAPITGSALDRATAAALRHTGGGTVVETEAGDDGAAYGLEVRLDNGNVVEVSLDENFNVIGNAADDDGAGDQSGPSDDDGAGDQSGPNDEDGAGDQSGPNDD
jgi:hypothetical protein